MTTCACACEQTSKGVNDTCRLRVGQLAEDEDERVWWRWDSRRRRGVSVGGVIAGPLIMLAAVAVLTVRGTSCNAR